MEVTRSVVALFTLLLVFPTLGLAQPNRAQPIDLGTLGGTSSSAVDINASGQIVGTAQVPDDTWRAFLWTAAGGMTALGILPGDNYSKAVAINSRGQVVGWSSGEFRRAFLWTANGGMVPLGTLGGHYSEPVDVNDSGQVAGTSTLAGDTSGRAFLWSASQGMIDLGTLGGTSSAARGVNSLGHVVGVSYTPGDAVTHAFLWTPTDGMVDLGTFSGGANSEALSINDSDQVVGWAEISGPLQRAFSWTPSAGMIDVSFGQYEAGAIAVNANGQVVGWHAANPRWTGVFSFTPEDGPWDTHEGGRPTAVNATGEVVGWHRIFSCGAACFYPHAFLWSQPPSEDYVWGVDLGTLGGMSSTAAAINDNGQAVGSSDLAGEPYRYHATLWNTRYEFSGFYGLQSAPTSNSVTAGKAVAVTFSLGRYYGLTIFARDSPSSQQVSCDTSAPIGSVERAVSGTANWPMYKAQTNRYSYAWQTQPSWAGTCRAFTVALNDGTTHIAYFRF